MSEKESELLNQIIKYYKENMTMPTRRYLQMVLGYKSVNSITQYYKSLEKEHYLIRNHENKLILSQYTPSYKKDIKNIKIINTKNQFIQVILNKKKKYLGYKINHNFFSNLGILKNDLLIIEEKISLKPNELGLFIIDDKYRVMKYNYKNGFYLLQDNEEIILHKVKILGKVIMIEKKL